MAIAGLPNVPILDSTIHVESLSSASGRRGNQRIRSTRASSILRMWRELEDERTRNSSRERGRSRVPQEGNDELSSFREGEVRGGLEDLSESENGSVINFTSEMGHVNEQEDHRSMASGQSRDLGEVERERVRKIFREWMINGGNSGTRHVAHINRGSRSQRFGENDRDRVRVVRDWVHMTSQQREARAGGRGDQVAGIASQIENFRNGQVLNHNERQPENSQRQIRRLCGRQALLDLLAKKEQERRDELQCLEGTRPVSGFAHRGRIQALLRLKSLQNRRRSTELRRPSSAAESELGLLRQRQTVAGLREGFMSRLDNNPHVQASDVSDGSSDNDSDAFRDDGSQANCASEILDGARDLNNPIADVLNVFHDEPSALGAVDVTPSTALPSVDPGIGPSADLNHPTQDGCMDPGSVVQSSNRTVGTGMDAVHKIPSQGALILNPTAFYELESPPRNESNTEPCNTARNYSNEETNSNQLGTHVEGRLERDTNIVERRPETATSVNSNGSSSDEVLEINPQESPGSEHEVDNENFSVREEADVHNVLDDQLDISGNLNDHDLNGPELDWQEGVSEFESVWEGSPLSDQWRDNHAETGGPRWAGEVEVQSHEALETEDVEQTDHDEYWDENHSLETGRDWLGLASGGLALASDRVDTYYFSDDENVYHIELRELVNRRRVSSLLDSDFRENLDRLIQSYVDRQTDTPDDWEHHDILPHFVSRNQELLHTEQEDDSEPYDMHANGNEVRLPPRPPPLPQAHWGRGLHQTNWARRNIHQQSGTKWELINDLRIDMTRLHQRLNNMQMMLEACMDMQVELQRSVRQEVSAALNRSNHPSESLENILPKDSFKWDSVRKGVCCICSSTNIDSLLYRCGHMCTCTNCANALLQGNGKCPMCQAPVVEVIRAYFIQ